MIKQLFKDIYNEEEAGDAIINDRHTMHKEDYLIIHCLLRKYKPCSFFEIGTNTGFGTMIIKNALGFNSVVFSLDLPDEEAYKSKQHPLSERKQKGVGWECTLPYIQLRGNSLSFNYGKYPCEGYFIDAEHTYENVVQETGAIVIFKPKIIIWHDTDEWLVYKAICDVMEHNPYDLYRVIDTRIAYAILQ